MGFTLEEELWFGTAPDTAAEQAAAKSMVARAAKILDLRPCPAAAQKLLALASDPDSTVAQMQAAIESDASLATRLLRMVNSAAMALRTPCTSIARAVVLLGRRPLTDLGVGLAILDGFPAGSDLQRLWLRQHSSSVAGLARRLAQLLGLSSADVLTLGLLHDVGKLFELQMGADDYHELLEEAGARPDSVHVAERAHHGYDHAVLAAHVLRGWSIPDPVPAVVALHHQPGRALAAGGALAQLTMLIRLADHLSYAFEETAAVADDGVVERMVEDEAAAYLGFGVRQLRGMWDELCMISRESNQLSA